MARILIVEDDAPMLRVLSMWLKKNGHRVVEARDGRQAAELLGHEAIDLILSDINMPVMSGIELTHCVRRTMRLDLPIILLSSRCDQSQIASNLVPFGVTVHPKPFSPRTLVEQIENALHERKVSSPVAVASPIPGGQKEP